MLWHCSFKSRIRNPISVPSHTSAPPGDPLNGVCVHWSCSPRRPCCTSEKGSPGSDTKALVIAQPPPSARLRGGGATRMCTAGAPPPPAHSWDVGRGPEGSVGSRRWTRPPRPPPLLSTRASFCPRRLPWPCAPRAAACWRSCCASPGGPWRWSPPSKGQAVQAAACVSVPLCAACICCWRPCPPWRRRPPSCECGPRGVGVRGICDLGVSRGADSWGMGVMVWKSGVVPASGAGCAGPFVRPG